MGMRARSTDYKEKWGGLLFAQESLEGCFALGHGAAQAYKTVNIPWA